MKSVYLWSKLNGLYLDLFLMLARFALAARLFVDKFSVVHNPANRRSGIRRNFHEIKTGVSGDTNGFVCCDYAAVITFIVDQADLSRSNTIIYAIVCADGLPHDTNKYS